MSSLFRSSSETCGLMAAGLNFVGMRCLPGRVSGAANRVSETWCRSRTTRLPRAAKPPHRTVSFSPDDYIAFGTFHDRKQFLALSFGHIEFGHCIVEVLAEGV